MLHESVEGVILKLIINFKSDSFVNPHVFIRDEYAKHFTSSFLDAATLTFKNNNAPWHPTLMLLT